MEIVAELSCNHLGSLDRALMLIRAAKEAGADAVKLQCWHPDRMVVDRSYTLTDGPWAGRNLYDLYNEAWTPWEWFPVLFERAAELGIDCFASVFDIEALSFLENIGCPRYKIASFEAKDLQLVRAVADTDKPLIVSTGLLAWDDIAYICDTIDCSQLTLLKCVSEYPAKAEHYNLQALDHLRDLADHVGVSDHTRGLAVPIAAATLEADMLEKHFTLSRADGGLDAAFSIEPRELRELVDACRAVEAALKEPGYVNPDTTNALKLGRSLYWAKDIKAGETITEAHLMTARPALGMALSEYDELLGSTARFDGVRGQPVKPPRNA